MGGEGEPSVKKLPITGFGSRIPRESNHSLNEHILRRYPYGTLGLADVRFDGSYPQEDLVSKILNKCFFLAYPNLAGNVPLPLQRILPKPK